MCTRALSTEARTPARQCEGFREAVRSNVLEKDRVNVLGLLILPTVCKGLIRVA